MIIMKTKLLKKIRREVMREIKVLQINDGYIISYYGVLSEFIISDFREAVMFCRSIRIRQAMDIIRRYKERKYQNRYKRVY